MTSATVCRWFLSVPVGEGDPLEAALRVSRYLDEITVEAPEGSKVIPSHHVRFSDLDWRQGNCSRLAPRRRCGCVGGVPARLHPEWRGGRSKCSVSVAIAVSQPSCKALQSATRGTWPKASTLSVGIRFQVWTGGPDSAHW
jgi:hypothetical protein